MNKKILALEDLIKSFGKQENLKPNSTQTKDTKNIGQSSSDINILSNEVKRLFSQIATLTEENRDRDSKFNVLGDELNQLRIKVFYFINLN